MPSLKNRFSVLFDSRTEEENEVINALPMTATTLTTEGGLGARRSKRQWFSPLEFWKNESVVYGREVGNDHVVVVAVKLSKT